LLCGGSIAERDNGRVYNTAYVFDPDGRCIAKHRKMHLFDIDVTGGQRFFESDTLSPGDSATVFDTPFGTMGLCICYDLRFPELARLMVDAGARVLLVPAAFNLTTGPAHWELLFRCRAVDNQVFTVGTAPARDETASYRSWGHSIVCSPWGEVLQEADEKECVLIAALDLGRVDKVRNELPVLRQRRTDLYRLEQI
jgi:predicted amidohydrolase